MVFVVPKLREFFALDLPPVIVLMAGLGVAGLGVGALVGGWLVVTAAQRWWVSRAAGHP